MPLIERGGASFGTLLLCAQLMIAIFSKSPGADTGSTPAISPPSPPPAQVKVVTADSLGQGLVGSEIKIHGQPRAPAEVELSGSPSDGGSPGRDGQSGNGSGEEFIQDPIVIGPGQCNWHIVNPPAEDASWQGNDPSTGMVIENNCDGPVRTLFLAVPNGSPAPPPPPQPEELAQRAYREMVMPRPNISAGPDRTKLAVNLWTWLWVDDPGPQTLTVSVGEISVTLTATLESVTWSLGEPAATGGSYAPGPPLSITCPGTGSAPQANYDWKAEPPCGHKYTWMSAKDRTGGSGKWPITATSNWNVTWQSNTGVSGSTVLTASSADALEIGEYRTVLVQGPGG